MRALFVAGASCFLAGTLTAALAPAFPVLLAGRLVQGVGTGVALPLMFNIILEQVPRKNMGAYDRYRQLHHLDGARHRPVARRLSRERPKLARAVFWVLVPLVAASFALGAACIRQSTTFGGARRSTSAASSCSLSGLPASSLPRTVPRQPGWASPRLCSACSSWQLPRSRCSAGTPLPRRVPCSMCACCATRCLPFSVAGILLVQFCTLGLAFLIPNYAQLSLGIDCVYRGLPAGSRMHRGRPSGAAFGHRLRSLWRRAFDYRRVRGHARVHNPVLRVRAHAYRAAHRSLLRALLVGERGANLPGNMTNGPGAPAHRA